jgi:pilus assembly protein CpaF
MFGKRTNPPLPFPEARAVPPTAVSGSGRPAPYDATKRAILVALAEAIVAAGTGPLDVETAREEIRDLASEIIASRSIVMSIAEQEDLLDNICNDVFR